MNSLSLTRASLAVVVLSFVSVSLCFGQVRYGLLGTAGWSEAHNGDIAGSSGGTPTGFYLRGIDFPVEYRIFVQGNKWLPWVQSTDANSTSGDGKVLQAIQFRFPDGIPAGKKLLASVNVAYENPIVEIQDGTILGTPGTGAVVTIQIAQGDNYTGDEILASPTPTPVHYHSGVPDLPGPLPRRQHVVGTPGPTPEIHFGGHFGGPFGRIATPAPTQQSTAIHDLSLFSAGPGKLGIRNNGSVCHIAVIAWSSSSTIQRVRVERFSQTVINAQTGTLIAEEPCP